MQEHVSHKSVFSKVVWTSQRNHKKNILLKEIVCSRGSVTYGVSKELVRICEPLMKQSTHHIHNTWEFIENIKNIKYSTGKCITLYDVTAVFTSVSVGPYIKIILDEKNVHNYSTEPTCQYHVSHNVLSSDSATLISSFKGSAMSKWKQQWWVLQSALLWLTYTWRNLKTRPLEHWEPTKTLERYIDDTFVIQEKQHKFLQHINTICSAIKFTVKDTRQGGAMPFLDTIITPTPGDTLSTGVYGKAIHTDLYLQWDSHYHLSETYSLIGKVTHRAKTVCWTPELVGKEMNTYRKHLANANTQCWALTEYKTGHNLNRGSPAPPTMQNWQTLTKTTVSCPTQKACMKVSRTYTTNMIYKNASEGDSLDMAFCKQLVILVID